MQFLGLYAATVCRHVRIIEVGCVAWWERVLVGRISGALGVRCDDRVVVWWTWGSLGWDLGLWSMGAGVDRDVMGPLVSVLECWASGGLREDLVWALGSLGETAWL